MMCGRYETVDASMVRCQVLGGRDSGVWLNGRIGLGDGVVTPVLDARCLRAPGDLVQQVVHCGGAG